MRLSFARLWAGVVLCISVVVGSGVRTVAGQSIAVTGRVVDAVSGQAVTGAQLAIGSRTVLTDADGQFRFDVAAGRWDIDVTARGYLPRTIAIEATSNGVAPIEIQLVAREGFQERLEVTAEAPKPEGPASMPLTPQQVLSTAGATTISLSSPTTIRSSSGRRASSRRCLVRSPLPRHTTTAFLPVDHEPGLG